MYMYMYMHVHNVVDCILYPHKLNNTCTMSCMCVHMSTLHTMTLLPLGEKQCCRDDYRELARGMLSFVRKLLDTLCVCVCVMLCVCVFVMWCVCVWGGACKSAHTNNMVL